MKVCYFGTFDPGYIRNAVIRKGLERNGVGVVLCRVDYTWSLRVFAALLWKWLFHTEKDVAAIIVGEGGYVLVPVAKFIGLLWRKPVILDGFFSVYQAYVVDRAIVGRNTIGAAKLHFIDKAGCLLADHVLLDTNAHISYFKQEFGVPAEKFLKIAVGADDSIYSPGDKPGASPEFTVLFFGSYIPLHGVEYILRAAKELEREADIKFILIGEGQTYPAALELAKDLRLKNVEFLPLMGETELASKIRTADICLGIFGATEKTQLVIPSKVYLALAMAKPVITARTQAVEELLKDRETAVLCEAANADSLAAAIVALRDDKDLRAGISRRGYSLYKEDCTPEKVVAPLLKLLGIYG